jgi:hypothetical protein
MEIELEDQSDKPPTILLGFEIGSATLDDGRKLSITGSGRKLRFEVFNTESRKMIKQYDLDLTPIASEVAHR